MKKIAIGLLIILLSSFVFLLGYNTKKNREPNYLYQVYLDDQVLGVIKSKDELEKYIDKQGSTIKEKYDVDKVFAPEGLNIRRIITYKNDVDEVADVYAKLSSLKPFTISGYQFTIKKEVKDDEGKSKEVEDVIYVTKESIFETSIKNAIKTFVGEDVYNKYLNNEQKVIKDTGIIYDNIYVDNDITKKRVSIPVNQKIYTDTEELSQYILFSTNNRGKNYTVKNGDTIEKVASQNKISVQEFLISNPEFTSKDNVLYNGQVVSVAYANPLVNVMADVTKVEDQVTRYAVEEQSSDSMSIGSEHIIQEGSNGISRVTQDIHFKNGFIQSAKNSKQIEIKPSTPKIVLVGTKYISGIGGGYWSWPTSSYSISSPFGWRSYEFHTGIDIYNYYGAPIYAANNGVVTIAGWYGTYGIFVGINHNNGYGTGYGHMSLLAPGIQVGSTVERGQIIGYIGSTGVASGPHVHFEAYYGSKHPGYNYNSFFDPNWIY